MQANSHPVMITGQFQWAAYTAALWSLLFAAVRFYWAFGGRIGANTIGPALLASAADPWFVALGLWGVGVIKLFGGLVALALVQPWGRFLPQIVLRTAAWIGGGFALFYGVALYVQHTLMVGGSIALPSGLGATAARWHLVLWDPWWILGGILFIGAARLARRPIRMPIPRAIINY